MFFTINKNKTNVSYQIENSIVFFNGKSENSYKGDTGTTTKIKYAVSGFIISYLIGNSGMSVSYDILTLNYKVETTIEKQIPMMLEHYSKQETSLKNINYCK